MQELLAKEQQEEQVLRDITGVQRLEDVTFLDAVVDCSETSLSNLGEKMPLLRELKLNNSALSSVRDLGSKLRQLQVLWVSHCGLTGLDGLSALPSLRELYAAYNHIDNLEPVADMEKLEVLDLEGNKVDDLGALVYLGWCPQLAVLTLADNPVAQEPAYSAQVGAALPKLQVLDDTKLERPLSPVSKLAHPHRLPHPGTAALDACASSVSNHHTPAQAVMVNTALYESGLVISPGSELPQYGSSNVVLAKANVRHSRQQRPASASRLQQRLPPVALGHNQPGSYLLYSLDQLPSDALQYTGQEQMAAAVPTLAPKVIAVAGTTQHCEALRLGQSFGREAYADVLGGISVGAHSRKVRPASAGIRQAESRLQSPCASESSRPGSADGDVSSSAGLEAAGLYWRKHRLLLPQGYTMTATQAQAAANPAAAEQQDPGSADATHAETDESIGSSAAAAQQRANQISIVEEQPNAELLQSECDGASRAEHAADVAERCQNRDYEHDSLAGANILMIEDAAELTCDRAAVILRQLSCECQAAGSCALKPGATCGTSAADEEQQHAALNQVEVDCRSAACRTKASAAALLLPAGAQLLLDKADRPEEEVMLLDQAERTAERPEEQVVEVQQGQSNASGSEVHAAGVQRDSGRALPSPGCHTSTSSHTPCASLSGATWQAHPGRGVTCDTVSTSMEQGSDSPAASTAQAPPQQGVSSSSFLQRLQMSKRADPSGLNVTYHQAKDRQGESNVSRPPSPERPPTPSSRPARRRHLTPAFTEADSSPPKASSWAGSNRMFAPMSQQLPGDSAHTHAALPARPASASVAECPRLAGSELSWTGSMQLPAGLLKLAARPQQASTGRKDKHQYDWGFGQARGLV